MIQIKLRYSDVKMFIYVQINFTQDLLMKAFVNRSFLKSETEEKVLETKSSCFIFTLKFKSSFDQNQFSNSRR